MSHHRKFVIEIDERRVFFFEYSTALAYAKEKFPQYEPKSLVHLGPDNAKMQPRLKKASASSSHTGTRFSFGRGLSAHPKSRDAKKARSRFYNYVSLEELEYEVDHGCPKPPKKSRKPRKPKSFEPLPSPFPDMVTAHEAAAIYGVTVREFERIAEAKGIYPISIPHDGITRRLFYRATLYAARVKTD